MPLLPVSLSACAALRLHPLFGAARQDLRRSVGWAGRRRHRRPLRFGM